MRVSRSPISQIWDHAACALLLGAGAAVNDGNRFRQTALHLALEEGHDAVAALLLASGADVHLARNGEITPLHLAAQFSGPEIVSALIRGGAAVDAKRHDEATPALMAAFAGRTDNLVLLAAAGADIVGARWEMNAGGPHDICLTVAAEQGHAATVDHLLAAHPWPQEVLNVALKLAAGEGRLAIVEALARGGADPFAPCGANQKSALERARQRKQKAVVDHFKTLKR